MLLARTRNPRSARLSHLLCTAESGVRFPSRPFLPRSNARIVSILRVQGGELYYEAEGDGVAVVLVHGLARDARMWDDQVPALKDIARVVRYDVRGFGRSTREAESSYSHADDLWRLLEHLGIDRAVLVGLSMGGRNVVEATRAAPERVRTLVLLDAVLDGVPWDPDSERGLQAVGEGLHSGGLDEAKEAWLRRDFFAPAQRRPDVARRLAEMDYSGVNWTSADPHAPHPNSIELPRRSPRRRQLLSPSWTFPVSTDVRRPGRSDSRPRRVTVAGVEHMVNPEAPEAVKRAAARGRASTARSRQARRAPMAFHFSFERVFAYTRNPRGLRSVTHDRNGPLAVEVRGPEQIDGVHRHDAGAVRGHHLQACGPD